MEVVEWVACVDRVGLGDRDVVEAAPLEEHAATRQGELLHHTADHLPANRASDGRQVGRPHLVARDERRVLRRQQELVQVRLPPAARGQPRDDPIGLIEDDVGSPAKSKIGLAFPPRQHRLAVVVTGAEVHRGVRRRRVEPDDVARVVEDQHATLPRA